MACVESVVALVRRFMKLQRKTPGSPAVPPHGPVTLLIHGHRYDSETGDAAFVDAGLVALPPQVAAAGASVKMLNLSENTLQYVGSPERLSSRVT